MGFFSRFASFRMTLRGVLFVILSPSPVILNEVKNLCPRLRINSVKNLKNIASRISSKVVCVSLSPIIENSGFDGLLGKDRTMDFSGWKSTESICHHLI